MRNQVDTIELPVKLVNNYVRPSKLAVFSAVEAEYRRDSWTLVSKIHLSMAGGEICCRVQGMKCPMGVRAGKGPSRVAKCKLTLIVLTRNINDS